MSAPPPGGDRVRMSAHTHLRRPPPSRGSTLAELATAMVLIAVGLTVALPPATTLRDRLAVGAASNEVVAIFVRARAAAPRFGGARVDVRAVEDEVLLVAADSVLARARLALEHGVDLVLTNGRDRAEIVYDALGLGRVASRTLVVRRGRAADTLRVSSYGRVAR